MDENIFAQLKMADATVLDAAEEKVDCSNCGRRRRYFCYACRNYVNGLEKVMPTVKLPIKIIIIKHRQELDSKSTAIHAALLAPDDCQIYTFPNIPACHPEKDLVIFPSKDSMTVDEWAKRVAVAKLAADVTISKQGYAAGHSGHVIFIDSTWNQIHPIINSPQLSALPKIALKNYETQFWRPNGSRRDASCLATIEAVYYFLREYHSIYLGLEYKGEYDNLLMIFKYMYLKIRDYHDGGDYLKAYKT
ncbi:tRNA-uridine aminocarboxypropyltransferase 1-like [Watersipora subatra]|uniref:tRNA-uridine aminocarboxypropyltransferase 1-like n=1 Tax=Watersipora subatra TaxID=2589382 RepID=UPI00355C2440